MAGVVKGLGQDVSWQGVVACRVSSLGFRV